MDDDKENRAIRPDESKKARFKKIRERSLKRGLTSKEGWLKQLGGSLPSVIMAGKMGIKESELELYRTSGRILGLPYKNDFLYPVWQVDENQNILIGLEQVILTLTASPGFNSVWTMLKFFVEGNRYLEIHLGSELATPAEALHKGHLDIINKAAAVYLVHGGL